MALVRKSHRPDRQLLWKATKDMDFREMDGWTSYLKARWYLVREHIERGDDRGDIVQTAIIIGLFAAAAIAVVAILVGKARDTANSVQTQ